MAESIVREQTEAAAETERPLFAWLTWEVALYGLLLALGLLLRLGLLEARIMDEPEAEQAWQAWQLANGGTPVGRWSPLLLSGQALLFALFGASDVTARLLPALAGSLVVLLPFTLRSLVGRFGALAAALALALSPTLVYSARYGDGTTLLLFCAFGALALWLAYREQRRTGYLYAISVLAALGLLADLRVVGLAIAGLVATALAFNPGGLGAWADMLSAWFGHLAPVVNGQPWYYPLVALVLYEPFALLFGLIGGATLLIRRKTLDTDGGGGRRLTLFVWLADGLTLLALISGGRGAGDVALICVPLALLAGWAVERLAARWQESTSLARDVLLAAVVLVIVIYVAMQVAFYANAVYTNAPQASQFVKFLMLALALLILLGGFSLAWLRGEASWRVGGAVLALVLISASFSAATRLNWERVNDPRELHVRVAPDVGLRDALDVATDLAYHRWGAAVSIPITVEKDLGTVWAWYLRDWENVTTVEALSSDVSTPMVLSTADAASSGGSTDWSPADRYIGQDFVTRAWWDPDQLFTNDRLSWWLYRKTISKPTPTQRVVVWIQAQDQ
jgi:4-amino-4-deoxy-L-arabinose transferase-like glycosyltransferase